jgi:YegS/Rv2252/BmrU family lipid kinase
VLTTATLSRRAKRIFVVVNPEAGSYTADVVRATLDRYFPTGDPFCEIHETGKDERIAEVVRDARGRGFDLVIAAGGDGTVSGVANSLVGSEIPLGIVPLGTTNVLARELGIPVDMEGACRLLAGEHAVTAVDAMRVGDQSYFTQIGVGLDAMMIRDTTSERKRRFGKLAYIGAVLKHLFGFQPRRFRVAVDGSVSRPHASEVLVANCGILGQPPFRWGPDIRPDDGRLDVCIIRARTLIDYLVLAWHFLLGLHRSAPNVRYRAAERAVVLDARHSLPVQADGEIIGETPVEVAVLPRAVRVVVPTPERVVSG